ncbi:MAG: pilus assembly PilX N-terminal domain-containing protein [Acidobacteria bacterium]|nr:pilus assembly PilX N-terminal domain-containing protein [Acidobacteriota bacterium]
MQKVYDRRGEKGAALVISILIATLLLAVAGTVILTTSMSAVTSIDATAEIQAYYGAETGLEAALNVIRGHVQPNGIAGTTRMSFLNAVKRTTSNHASDTAAVARLSAWLNYDQNVWRVRPSGANYSYSVVVMDPDDPTGALRNADAAYRPTRLQVQSTGYGPKGSVKRMEMVVQKVSFDFEPDAMLLARSSDDGLLASMSFDIGTSAAKLYSGHDNAAVKPNLPTFGVTSLGDLAVANLAITKGSTVDEVKTHQVDIADLPSWLQTADAAREFLNYMQIVARSMGRYYTSLSGMAGSTSSPAYTFVNGDVTLDGGAGLLIVTGDLILNGNAVFNGTILVLGDGQVIRDGGGNGTILGSIYVARFARSWPSSENGDPHPFLAPVVNIGGGGTANFKYDSNWVQTSKDVLGDIVRDVREY